MSEQLTNTHILTLAGDEEAPGKADRSVLELKIAELTGTAEYLAQTIDISQGYVERLEKEIEDLQRQKQQAKAELDAQEQVNVNMRRDLHHLEMEIKKDEATVINQQERIRILNESIITAEWRSKQAIEAFQEETDSKIKAIKNDFEGERDRYITELEGHRNQIQAEMKQLTEEAQQARKKQHRAFEIEFQDMKRKAEETIAKILQDGRSKNEALIKATEATALEVHRESESAAKRFIQETNQKAADILRAAQLEAEDIRRRTHNAEVSFLKEKNSGLAELKLLVANAKEEAQAIIAAAMQEATELQYKVEKENESKINTANTKISLARKAAEKERQDLIEKTNADLIKQIKDQEEILARKSKESEEHLADERIRFEDEARSLLSSARERAQVIIETADNEKNYKYEELKAMESSMFESARQATAVISYDAEKIALRIVEEARTRARNIEKVVEEIIVKNTEEASKIKVAAEAYAERIKRELPDIEQWETELGKIRLEERDRLQAQIEPTVKNYLKAIDKAIHDIFLDLPAKYQNVKVIQDFMEAITSIQNKKNQINFGNMIPKLVVLQQVKETTDDIHPQLKKSS